MKSRIVVACALSMLGVATACDRDAGGAPEPSLVAQAEGAEPTVSEPVARGEADEVRPSSPEPARESKSTAEPGEPPSVPKSEPKVDTAPVAEPPSPAVTFTPLTPTQWKPAGGALVSRDELLSEKMERRLRSQLRRTHGATVLLASKLVVPEPDGGVTVFGLYHYSLLQACVTAGGGTKDARADCIASAVDERGLYGDYAPGDVDCTQHGLVRARFGAPPTKTPLYGGALSVIATRSLSGGCTIREVLDFSLRDVDADGAPELELSYMAATPEPYARGGGTYAEFDHQRGWYREDLSPQTELVQSVWVEDDSAWGYVESSRVELVDVGGDGRVDLRLSSISAKYDAEGSLPQECYPKLDGTPVDAKRCSDALGDEEYEHVGGATLETSVAHYDVETDQWGELVDASP